MISKSVQYSLTFWMAFVLLMVAAEGFWGGRISIPLWIAGLLPPAMLLATIHWSQHARPRALHVSRRRS